MDPVVDSAAPDPAPDAVVANVDPVAVPPAADPLPTDAAPTPPKKEPPPKWMLDRVAEETGKRRAVEGKVAELSDEVATLRRQLEAARGGQPPAQQPAKPAQQAAVSQAQIDQAIEQRADAKLMQQARGEIVRAGHAEFGPSSSIRPATSSPPSIASTTASLPTCWRSTARTRTSCLRRLQCSLRRQGASLSSIPAPVSPDSRGCP